MAEGDFIEAVLLRLPPKVWSEWSAKAMSEDMSNDPVGGVLEERLRSGEQLTSEDLMKAFGGR